MVRLQIPMGEDDAHEGVIDLLRLKAYLFEGNMGNEIKEIEIPEKLLADAKNIGQN